MVVEALTKACSKQLLLKGRGAGVCLLTATALSAMLLCNGVRQAQARANESTVQHTAAHAVENILPGPCTRAVQLMTPTGCGLQQHMILSTMSIWPYPMPLIGTGLLFLESVTASA